MSVLNIRPAVRGQAKAIIGIAGVSGSGKTYTALKMARGMVSNASEIGFLDTENKRGSLYSDILDGQFMIGDLYPPFSPARYTEAIREFQNAGIKVLVIDSVSHEWEGEGGCDDIAHKKMGKMDNWIGAKAEHKRFMNTLLQCNMHIICCIRAREKTDFKNPDKPVSLGIQPICEKNFMFEMTASVLIENEGKNQKFLKVPSFLKKTFGDGARYLGESTGKDIINWLDTGEKEDPEITKTKSEMLLTCESGLEALVKAFEALSKELQEKMKPHMGVYKASAKSYDEAKKQESSGDDLFDQLNGLYDRNKGGLSTAQDGDIKRIIDNKEVSSYQKAINILKEIDA
jgi:ABC-type dipeptide/oligopeptide/nickel transport system ATPase component